jgi:hypothetical protein
MERVAQPSEDVPLDRCAISAPIGRLQFSRVLHWRSGSKYSSLGRYEVSGPVRGGDLLQDLNPDDAQNRRILRRGDPPQNLQDAAALNLLCVLERVPQLDIVRLTVRTADPKGGQSHGASARATRGIMLLELKGADYPMGSTRGPLYLRVELALAEVLTMSVEELVGRLYDELSVIESLISALALKGGSPHPDVVLAN